MTVSSLLGVTASVLFSVCCSAHTLFGFTLSVLSSVRPDVLCGCSRKADLSSHLRRDPVP
jgi:hypothetical protein